MRSVYGTPALNVSAAQPNPKLARRWVVTAWVALVAAGCSVEPENPAEEAGANLESLVDAGVLANIGTLESALVGPNLMHEGRIWYSPDLVTTFLIAKDGSGMAFTLGDASDYAALESPPPIGDAAPLWDVVAQRAEEPTYVFTSESGLDVVLFEADAPANSGISQTTEALSGPQSCPTTFFPETCNPDNQLQYGGSVLSFTLDDADRLTNANSSWSDVESSTIAVCSEVGSQRLVVTTSNPAWGIVPGGTGIGGLTIAQGQIGVWANFGTWRERRFCNQKVLGVCVDFDFRLEYQDFDVAFSITPLNTGSEYSYCANFYRKGDDINQARCNDCPEVRPGG